MVQSVFYFTESVYELAGKALMEGEPIGESPAVLLLFQTFLSNARGRHMTFTTDQILESVKGEEYANEFSGLIDLGENLAFPEKCEYIHGNKNFRLIQCALNKDGEVEGDVKIVSGNYEDTQYIKRVIEENDYPLEVVSIEDALEEMRSM